MAGAFIEQMFTVVLGSEYRYIFSPIVGIVGILVLIGRIRMNIFRIIGIGFFFVSVASLAGTFGSNTCTLDIHETLIGWMGSVPAGVLLVGVFVFALYAAVSMPWIRIFSHIHRTLPDIGEVYNGTVESIRTEYERDRAKANLVKIDTHREKLQELDKQISSLRGESDKTEVPKESS